MSTNTTLALIGGSGAIVVLGGVAALIAERRRRPRRAGAADIARWSSVSEVALAVGVCLFVLGWEVGLWCVAVGAGLAALGLLGVVREVRAQRRARR